MRGRNQKDVERSTALYRSLYQAQLDLEAQTACPEGHSFSDGYDSKDGQVVAVKVNFHVEPDGRVVCRLCRNTRAVNYRHQITETAEAEAGAALKAEMKAEEMAVQ